MSIFPSEEDFLLRPLHEGESMPIDPKDKQIKELQTENAYLRAEFEANKAKVYTQEEMDRFIEVSFLRGQKNANYK